MPEMFYVDDLVIISANLDEVGCVRLWLAASFDMKDLGDLHYFLEDICTLEGILISQRHYVLSMLFKFGMKDCKSVLTALVRHVTLRPKSGTTCNLTRSNK